jgi:nucleoside transporter
MSQTTAPDRTALPVKLRLYAMMFLQYAVQGSYLPVVAVYLQDTLGFTTTHIALFGAALAVGLLLAPFVVGQLADRYFATEHVLAACHLLAAGLMTLLYFQTQFWPVFLIGLVYSVLYVPTLMLANALAFHHLNLRDREYPIVRLFGTIGYVVPAFGIEMLWLRGLTGAELSAARGVVLLAAAGCGYLMAAYCLTLPHTPPRPSSAERFAPAAVLGLLRRPDVRVLVLASLIAAASHQVFLLFNSPFLRWFLDGVGIHEAVEQRFSTIGQAAEIPVMAGLGLALARLGFKAVLTVGAVAYVLRFLIFGGIAGWLPQWTDPGGAMIGLLCLGLAMHGFCVACFWAAGFLFVDRVAPPDVRGSMQTFYGTSLFGLGMLLGGAVSILVGTLFSIGTGANLVRDWNAIWLTSALLPALAVVLLASFFPRRGPD